MPYLRNSLKSGVLYVFRGRIKAKGQRLILEQPTVFRPEQYEGLIGTMLPNYTLVKGLTNQMVTKAVRQVIADKQLLSDAMPEAIREQYALAEYNFRSSRSIFHRRIRRCSWQGAGLYLMNFFISFCSFAD